jgi:hypothetical protein
MKKTFTPLSFIIIAATSVSISQNAHAQCTAAELNWDNLDFLPSNNVRYTSFYPSVAFPYNQNFTIGTRTVNFVMAPASNIALDGENGTNTAHAGSLAGAGDDVQFTTSASSNSTITITFDLEITNLAFSMFDLDNSQSVNFTAVNAGGTLQNITVVRANTGSGITITGSGGTNVTATGPGAGYANTDNNGTINVTSSGPVKSITITLASAAGNVWLSDIDACVTGTFPNNYQQISRPFTGQPQYVLTVVNNNIYYTNPVNGNAYFLFNEPGHNRLNSMAYDPYERIVYYTYSLTGGTNPPNDKTLKKYDVDTKTISVVIPNVNTFGIPTYESGVESGAATFYNGSLYLGIEGYTGTDNSGSPYAAGRKSTIWKINFDAAGNAVPPAAQVWGITADDGVNAQNIHDWSDFGITNGVLIDYDGSGSGSIEYTHTNLFTGVKTGYTPVGPTPRQVSIGWDEKLYNVDAVISLYNGTNGQGTPFTIFAPLGPTIPTGSAASWGDAAGPYRPFLDFGDAPATYDPDPWSPACHDTLTPTVTGRRTRMILGPAEDVEWLKRGFTTVEDNFEDGISFVPIFSKSTGSYLARATVFNNSGSNATVCAWLDFNGNGIFDPGEGITPITIPSSTAVQNINLLWPWTPSTIPRNTFTYLRVRITSAAYGMTQNNPTGYYDRGEVEDYRVLVEDFPLSVSMISFDAKATDDAKVKLTWSASEELSFLGYDVQRNTNGGEWENIAFVPASYSGGKQEYTLMDEDPYRGISQYRLKLNGANGQIRYSNIRTVQIIDPSITVYPNPVRNKARITLNADATGEVWEINIMDAKGNSISYQKVTLSAGTNSVELPIQDVWPSGVYYVRVGNDRKVATKQFVLRR